MNNEYVIEVSGLGKEFFVYNTGTGLVDSLKTLFHRKKRVIKAVEDVSFKIQAGEFVGYLGENGAGKSTTIKMLTGILYPSSGVCKVNGMIPSANRKLSAQGIGVVFGQRTQLWWDLPVRESFNMLRNIYRVKQSDYLSRIKRLEKVLDLGPLLDVPVRKLSLGQKMRCDLAASLIHNPPLIFLDEPTIGLDVIVKESIRNFLEELNKREGTTIILTTHDMNDVEHLCHRLIILDRGSVVYDGDKDALIKKCIHEKLIEIEFEEDLPGMPDIPELVQVSAQGNKKTFTLKRNGVGVPEVIGRVVSKYKVVDLSIRNPSVESIIKSIYEKKDFLPTQTEGEPVP